MQDPLNVHVALTGVESTLPLLPEGDYEVQIKESTVEPNKDKTGLNWNLKYGLCSAVTAVDGRQVNPDFSLFSVHALQPAAESKDPEAFKRNLAETMDAIYGTTKDTRSDFTRDVVTGAVGRIVTARVSIDEYQGNKNNKVRRLVKRAVSPL